MSKMLCVECGTCFDTTQECCPNCGCPKSACTPQSDSYTDVPTVVTLYKGDVYHYIYECGVLFWDTFRHRYANFSGRASRREFFSFMILVWFIPGLSLFLLFPPFLVVYFFACIIPYISVAVRRMHDVNKSGWWTLCPVAWFFLPLKKSDNGINNYGMPMDYSQIFD